MPFSTPHPTGRHREAQPDRHLSLEVPLMRRLVDILPPWVVFLVGLLLVAGVGYGVVFAECLAAHIKAHFPSATSLRLSLATKNVGRSRGATLSTAVTLAAGACARQVRQAERRRRMPREPCRPGQRMSGRPTELCGPKSGSSSGAHRGCAPRKKHTPVSSPRLRKLNSKLKRLGRNF